MVSVCKLKTHSMTTLSGGVKNLFGCIPGLQKPELHLRFPEKADFGEMLVDLALTVKPALTIVDAVVGMEGDGPSAAVPGNWASWLPAKIPSCWIWPSAGIIAWPRKAVPTIAASQNRGLCPENADALSLAGEVQFARTGAGICAAPCQVSGLPQPYAPAAAPGGEPPVGSSHPPPGDPPEGLCRLRTLCRELSGAYHHHRERQGADPVRPVHPLLLLP